MKDLEEQITGKINMNVNEKFCTLKEVLENLCTQVKEQELRLNRLDKSVETNVIFFNINESEKNYFNLQNIVFSLIKKEKN